MTVNINQDTGIAPVANPVEGGLAPASAIPSTPAPAVPQPVPGGLPIASDPLVPQMQSEAAQPPPVDWEAQARAAQAEAQAAKAQAAQIQQQIAQAVDMQRRQNEEHQFKTQAQTQLDQAYAMAEQMDPDRAFKYVRQAEDQFRSQMSARQQQAQQEMQNQFAQQIHRLAAPQYAQELARRHNLPADLAAQLTPLPPQIMDSVAPSLAAAARAREQAAATQRQAQLTQQAQQMQQSGAYQVGGVVASAPTASAQRDTRSDRAKKVSAYRQSGRGD
jgi:hypothetical protein